MKRTLFFGAIAALALAVASPALAQEVPQIGGIMSPLQVRETTGLNVFATLGDIRTLTTECENTTLSWRDRFDKAAQTTEPKIEKGSYTLLRASTQTVLRPDGRVCTIAHIEFVDNINLDHEEDVAETEAETEAPKVAEADPVQRDLSDLREHWHRFTAPPAEFHGGDIHHSALRTSDQ